MIKLLKQSLAIFQELDDDFGITMTIFEMGYALKTPAGDPYLRESLRRARAAGDTNVITMSLFKLGAYALERGAIDQAEELLEEARRSGSAGGDLRSTMHATGLLGYVALARGDFDHAEAILRELLEYARKFGELIEIDQALSGLALVAYWRGDAPAGERLVVEALANPLVRGRPLQIAWLNRLRGLLAEQQGDLARAAALLHDSLARYRDLDDSGGIARALASIGHLRQPTGDQEGAGAAFRASLIHPELSPFGVATCLVGMAALADARGDAIRAARLWGAAEALGAGSRPDLSECRPDDAPRIATARARIRPPALAAAWAACTALTSAQAAAEALGE